MLDHLRGDVISTLRGLRAAPATAAAIVLTLAVAVGINLAMFGLLSRALLSPPAEVKSPGRVFTLSFQHEGPDGQPLQMATTSYVTFEAVRDNVAAAESTSAWQHRSAAAIVNGEQIQTETSAVTGSYFGMLGARALLGRTILPDDDHGPLGAPIAVVSHAFWRTTLAGDRNVLGRHLSLRGSDSVIVGVMPPAFSGHAATRTDVWVPLHAAMDAGPGWERNPYLNILEVGIRVRGDQGSGAAGAQAAAATGHPVVLSPIVGTAVSPAEHTMAYWLAAVSLLVLVIGLANAATLLLVRQARRDRELRIRVALGATLPRLFSQLVVEAGLLAAIATSAALALASWFDDAVRQLLLPSLVENSGLTSRVATAAALAGLSALLVGAGVGALQLRGVRRSARLQVDRSRPRSGTLLLVTQMALAVLLLAGAGTFGRSFYALAGQDLGMRMGDVLLVHFEEGPGSVAGQDQLFMSALARIRALPGVALASPISSLPFTGHHVPPLSVPGLAAPPTIDGQLPFLIAATPELFSILDLEVRKGRILNAADDSGPPVAIVNETMAGTVWPGKDPIGQCFRIGFDPDFDPADGPPAPPASTPCRQVVGVVGDTRQRSLLPTGSEARLMQYDVPLSQVPPPPSFVLAGAPPGPRVSGLVVRTSGNVRGLDTSIRRIVLDGRTDVPFLYVRPYASVLDRQIRPWRTGTLLFALFSGLALLVSATGLYAAFAHAVGERRREMAIRVAIGARPQRVVGLILREAAVLAAAGILVGCVAAAIAGRWTESMLFGTIAIDPLVLGVAAALMLAVALLATALPARSASRADPCDLLKAE